MRNGTMRVPDFPPKPIQPITRLSQFRDAGYILISHCSSGSGHEHVIVYDVIIDRLGDAEVDYALKIAMSCPECGANGGGMTILPPRG
jgi:hypothetical protein